MASPTNSSPSAEGGILEAPSNPSEGEFGELEQLPWTGITVVIAVLGLLMFMAVPLRQPSAHEKLAAQRHRAAVVAHETLQRAIGDFRADHAEWPGRRLGESTTLAPPVYDADVLVRQLEQHTDRHGDTLPAEEPGYDHGPYLPNGVPKNPATGLASIRILEEGERFEHVVDGLYGWVFDPRTGEVRPHHQPFVSAAGTRSTTRHGGVLER